MATLVRDHVQAVHPDCRAVIHRAEVKQEAAAVHRCVLEGARVPDHVMESSLTDAGSLCLVAERDSDPPVERRTVQTQVVRGQALPAFGEPDVRVVEGEAPLAVQVGPVLATELRARVLGTWRRDQLSVPLSARYVSQSFGVAAGDPCQRGTQHCGSGQASSKPRTSASNCWKSCRYSARSRTCLGTRSFSRQYAASAPA